MQCHRVEPNEHLDTDPVLPIQDLGRVSYAPAYAEQIRRHERVLAARLAGAPLLGEILLVEHDPVITVSRRPAARQNLLASPELLAHHHVALEETDRGGDITYHGPGQLVVYPILDIERLGLGVHDHVRLMERAVIETCEHFGVDARRDSTATGVWVNPKGLMDTHHPDGVHPRAGKIAAMGVRVRKWITLHGLSFNVAPDLAHFSLIVPCGLAGRPITSLQQELHGACPSMPDVKRELAQRLRTLVLGAKGQWKTRT
jgi:lipoyl(octanoyl) transferase